MAVQTPNKNLTKPAAGDLNWDGPVNADWDAIDNAFGGFATKVVTGLFGTQNISTAEAQCAIIVFSGTLTNNLIYKLPAPATGSGGTNPCVGGTWVIRNQTANGTGGPFTITIQPFSGTGTTVIAPQTSTRTIYSDGTNVGFADEQGAFFDPGVVMLFAQTTAPTGWVKSVANNDKVLRVVSGTASTGGSIPFTTAFTSQSVAGTISGTALSTAQIPSHRHTTFLSSSASTDTQITGDARASVAYTTGNPASGYIIRGTDTTTEPTLGPTSAVGSGSTHTHTFTGTAIDLTVQYVDVIIATKS
jgi:hypothetical protein